MDPQNHYYWNSFIAKEKTATLFNVFFSHYIRMDAAAKARDILASSLHGHDSQTGEDKALLT